MDVSAPPPIGFRYPKPTDEDLPALARLAYAVSADECDTCRNYHALWPLMRSIGANGLGPEFAFDLQRAILKRSVAGRDRVRWLVAGTADAGLLALVRSLLDEAAANTVTVVDRCGTPLALCRAYADQAGIAVETVKSDLRDFACDASADVVLLHHVLNFFDEAGRMAVLRATASWLAPGGRAVFAITDKVTADASHQARRRAWQRQALEADVARRAVDLPEDRATLFARLDGWQALRSPGAKAAAWGTTEHLRAMTECGLAVVETVPLPFAEGEVDGLGAVPHPRIVVVCEPAAG